MAQIFKIPGQNYSVSIPEIGEVFTDGDSIMKRTGEDTFTRLSEARVASTDLKIGNQIFKAGESIEGVRGDSVPWDITKNQPDRGFRGKHSQPTSGQNLWTNSGNSVSSLQKYNLGDLNTAISSIYGTGVNMQDAKSNTISDFTPTNIQDSGEVFTQTVDPTNANAPIVTSNKQGIVQDTPTSALAQQAINSGQGTTPPEDLTQVRAPETFDPKAFGTAIESNNADEARRIGSLPAVDAIQSATNVATQAAQVAGLPAFQPGATVQNGVATPTQAGIDQLAGVTAAPLGSPQASADVVASSTQAAQVAGLPDFQPGADNILMQRYADQVKASMPTSTPGVIGVNDIATPAKPLTLPTYTPPDTPQTTDLQDLVTQAEKFFQPSPQELELKRQQEQVADLTGQSLTKNQRRAELEIDGGIDEKNSRLQSLTNQLRNLNAQAAQASATAEDRLAPTFAITGEQAGIERQRAVKQLGIAAQQQAVQGEIGLAMDLVDRALAAEFEPIEAQLATLELQMRATQDALDRGDIRKTNALNMALSEQTRLIAEQKQVIADQKTEKKDIQVLALSAAENGASDSEVRQILASGSFEAALQAATPALRPKPKATSGAVSVLSADALKKLDEIGFAVQPGDTMTDVSARNQVPEDTVINSAVDAGDSKDGFFTKIGNSIKNFFGGNTNQDFVNNL